jgi:hypothetical protein
MKNIWLAKVIEDKKILAELKNEIIVKNFQCVICKGSRLLCGKKRCPIMVRFYAYLKTKPLINTTTLEGSSPPAIFVGRIGYPYVYIGPMVPPFRGNTSLLDIPELWHGKGIVEIVEFRSKLVRGKFRTHVKKFDNKIVGLTWELVLSRKSVDIEVEFSKKPSGRIVFDSNVQPIGPSAPLKNLEIDTFKTDFKIEKCFYDTDLKAAEAVTWLYRKKVLVSKIQRAFSAGIFGVEENRKLVPTRWSITAVDSIISKHLIEKIKDFSPINEFRVYEHYALDNKWVVLMIPSYWSYEQIEAWYPKTSWNPSENQIWAISDWEEFDGRSGYAITGGCYYATRLAVCEALEREKRQAAVITLREIYPGYIMPVGVWHTRESIRAALKKKPMKFRTLREALSYIDSITKLPLNKIIKSINLLRSFLYQRKLTDFTSTKILNIKSNFILRQ